MTLNARLWPWPIRRTSLLDSAHTDMDNITGDARKLLANLNEITDKTNQQHIASVLANADTMMTRTAAED